LPPSATIAAALTAASHPSFVVGARLFSPLAVITEPEAPQKTSADGSMMRSIRSFKLNIVLGAGGGGGAEQATSKLQHAMNFTTRTIVLPPVTTNYPLDVSAAILLRLPTSFK
jgi:hypothetical protein